ncbi:MAG: hypothetical protein QOJ29_3079 [Thermoleophilaceae bacterium]|nr:hypothetical protein [Thermoleophilaceae bacterium]
MADTQPLSYQYLSPEEQVQIVESRLRQYEAEHYSHLLNRRALERSVDLPDEDKRLQLAQLDQRLESIERSIELHRDELARAKEE